MATLPYMYQLPQDYYRNNFPVSAPVPTPAPTLPELVVPIPTPPSPGPPASQSGGVWYGSIPPSNPAIGWLWLNSSNNGLYIYTDPNVWTQIGTNW